MLVPREEPAPPALSAGSRARPAPAARQPQPELHLRGDRDARYERVAQALAAAQRSGLHRIGFVTEPKAP